MEIQSALSEVDWP